MPREHMIRAALQLLDECGAAEFSLRALAKHLHSSTATLYRHFVSKDELLAEVGEHLLGEAWKSMPRRQAGAGGGAGVEDRRDAWRGEIFTAADALFRILEAHPHMVAVLSKGVAVGPNALVMREYVLFGLIEGGFSPEIASKAFTSTMRYTLGFSAQLAGPDLSDGEAGLELRDFFASLDRDRFPATTASASYLPAGLREEFEFGLGCLIDGLEGKKAP